MKLQLLLEVPIDIHEILDYLPSLLSLWDNLFYLFIYLDSLQLKVFFLKKKNTFLLQNLELLYLVVLQILHEVFLYKLEYFLNNAKFDLWGRIDNLVIYVGRKKKKRKWEKNRKWVPSDKTLFNIKMSDNII